jgi:hypothetical protein
VFWCSENNFFKWDEGRERAMIPLKPEHHLLPKTGI